MNDSIKNVSETVNALTEFNDALINFGNTIGGEDGTELKTNQNQLRAAWESENATAFLTEYNNLIEYTTSAYKSLVKYQQKIQNVVNEFQGFDTTIEQGEE